MSATLNQTCSNCSEFQPSAQLPNVGNCQQDSDRVLATDKPCNRLQTFKAGGRTMVRLGRSVAGID
jgi:hypothetical protein